MEHRDNLLRAATKEFESCDIDRIVEIYKPTLDEFCAVSEHIRNSQPRYNEIFERLVDTICEEYNVKRDIMYVRLGNYGTNVWGNLYWRFLHLTSILLEQAMHANRVNDPLDFPLLVYNIDCILPCTNCALHYRLIKDSTDVKATIKDMSFGMLMSGLQAFHNIVTQNVDKMPEYANMPDRAPFSTLDFVREYRCVERLPGNFLKSKIYVRPSVDWQPNTHRMLTIFYALATKRTYTPCSDILKLRLYDNSAKIVVPTTDDNIITTTRDQIMNDIDRAILMNVDEQVATSNAQIYNQTIVEFYHAYPDYVRTLLESWDYGNDDETRDRIKEKITRLLKEIATPGENDK